MQFAKVHFSKLSTLFLNPLFQTSPPCHRRCPPHAAGSRRLLQGYLFRPPCPVDLVKILRQRQRRAAKLHTPRHSRRDALRLTAADILPLRLGHKGQDLQDQIAINVPIRSFPCRVSSSGMSSTQISTFFSLVSTRHCC